MRKGEGGEGGREGEGRGGEGRGGEGEGGRERESETEIVVPCLCS